MFARYAMILGSLFFSGAFIAGKFSVIEFPIFSLIFFRFFVATILLFGILIYKKIDLKISKNNIPIIFLSSSLGVIGYQLLFLQALKYTSSINTSLILAITPIITTLLSFLFFKEVISKITFLGILISISGAFLIITNGSLNLIKTLNFNIGDLFMLGATLFLSINFIVCKKALEKINPLKLTAYISLITTIIFIPGLIYDNPFSYINHVTFKGWSSLMYMSVFASVFAYLLQQISIKKIGSINTSLYMNLVPLYSVILSFLILKVKISPQESFAGFLIIFGVILTIKNKVKFKI